MRYGGASALFSSSVAIALVGCCVLAAAVAASEKKLGVVEEIFVPNTLRTFESKILGKTLVIPPGVFFPVEAEQDVLPYMRDHRQIFEGKRVLEIGTGSGIIALYAASLGASRVTATDIDPKALRAARDNAKALGLDSVTDFRLVPKMDMRAFSVIEDSAVFDVIISNPPFSLDLEAETNDPFTDTGDLGISLIRGLHSHLSPDGRAVLFYGSVFYHKFIEQFALEQGFEVKSYLPKLFMHFELNTLMNNYVGLLLQKYDMTDSEIEIHFEVPLGVRDKTETNPENLRYPGMIIIEKKRDSEASSDRR